MKKLVSLITSIMVLSLSTVHATGILGGIEDAVLLGGDKDSHGCIGSAGYSWSETFQKCVRTWEEEIIQAHKFALDKKITSIAKFEDFRGNDFISRQEASKMFVSFSKDYLTSEQLAKRKESQSTCTFSDKSLFGTTLEPFILSACEYGFIRGGMENGKSVFNPQGNLTHGQALAILVRIINGKADESVNPWYQGYINTINIYELIDLSNIKNRDAPISRAQLITRMFNATNTRFNIDYPLPDKSVACSAYVQLSKCLIYQTPVNQKQKVFEEFELMFKERSGFEGTNLEKTCKKTMDKIYYNKDVLKDSGCSI